MWERCMRVSCILDARADNVIRLTSNKFPTFVIIVWITFYCLWILNKWIFAHFIYWETKLSEFLGKYFVESVMQKWVKVKLVSVLFFVIHLNIDSVQKLSLKKFSYLFYKIRWKNWLIFAPIFLFKVPSTMYDAIKHK